MNPLSSVFCLRLICHRHLFLWSNLFIIGLLAFAHPLSVTAATESSPTQSTYYVSKNGTNQDGTSWATAWNELDQIPWAQIKPGDLILLDGGETEMVYYTTLTIEQSGTRDQPITIRLSDEAHHNGKVTIFGGRSTPLPYCNQQDYDYQDDGARFYGIYIDGRWITIEGTKWSGIEIYGHNRNGIRFDNSAGNILVRNITIYDNGSATLTAEGWLPDLPGVRLAGPNVTFERAIIYDNGQDAFQSSHGDNGIENFTIRQSWLHNSRRHPSVDEAFNWCRHTDAVQIHDGGTHTGFLFEESVFGPGFTNTVNMGERGSGGGAIRAVTHDVTFRNMLLTKAADNNILSHPRTDEKPQRWVIDHVTSHCPKTKGHCLYLEGFNHTITNSIFVGANITLKDGLRTYGDNCLWGIKNLRQAFPLGATIQPHFVNVNEGDHFSQDDYALDAGSPCAGIGSSIRSVAQLLALPDDGPGSTIPRPDPTPGSTLPKLEWEAESGEIQAPFTVQGGYIVQAAEVGTPAEGGRAFYKFTIATAGTYVVTARVNAPTGGTNSLFFDIDAEPSGDYMIWDIKVTDGFAKRTASWRGSGTFATSEFRPALFPLEAGEHTLTLRGREGNVQLDKIGIELYNPSGSLDFDLFLPLVHR